MHSQPFQPITTLRRHAFRCLAALCLTSSLSLAGAAEAPAFSTDITLADIMNSMVMASANVLWEAVYPDSSPSGEDIMVGPDSDEAWQKVRDAAITLAASTNLLLVPGLQVRDPALTIETPPGELSSAAIAELIRTQQPAWAAYSAVMHATAMQALAAIDQRDTKALYDITGNLDGPCTSCHTQFWYPEQAAQ